jgi:hypothetical protein
MGFIYKIENKQNQKVYIGKTVNTIKERWLEHVDEAKRGDNSLLHKAIRKYGENNFCVDFIEECSNDDLSIKEIYYIALFQSHLEHNGYNMTLGGEGALKYSDGDILDLWACGLRACEIAERLKANPNTISQRLKHLVENGEVRKRYFENRKKSVIQYDIYGDPIKIWDCASNAETTLGISKGMISKCCNKLATIAGDYLWKFIDDPTPINDLQEKYALSNKCCFVNLIDDNGEIIRTYESGKAAEIDLDLPRGKVSEVCNQKRKHTKNYKFEWGYPIKRRLINDRIKSGTKENC